VERVSVRRTVLASARRAIIRVSAFGIVSGPLGETGLSQVAVSLKLPGQSATGVALFSAGTAIATFRSTIGRDVQALVTTKNVVQTALILLGVQSQMAKVRAASVLLHSMGSAHW
jgi:hypothetical protein